MRRVLVIDDNEDLRELMQVILAEGGYTVDSAPSGIIGLEMLRRAPYELVLTDLFMPHQDGIETIGLLRKEHPDVKVLAVSGGGRVSASHSYLLTAMQIGADDVLAKPFEPEALLATARKLLGD